ncbi:MAG TPA: peptidylprolyl isomerase [Spirochaetota bacterium]|nr:peptidylprolyl isomerase [Spirochaetota bacterium]
MRYIIFFAAFLLVFSCAGDPSKIVIAKFDSGVVNLKEAKDEYSKISDQDKSKYKSDEDYFRLVRKIALEKIMIQAAYKSGVAEEEEFVKRFEESKKNIAYNILKKKNVLDKITVTEADYEKYKKSYELYQIVKRTDILDENKILKAKKSLEKLSKELKDLKSFQDAARIYSEDVTASEGGFVGNLRLGVMEEEIDKVMENLGTGRCSKVIETGVGAHLIFINKIDSIPFNDLLQDKKLHEAIYNAKVENIENKWYDNLLKSPELKIDEIKLKKRKTIPKS